MTGPFCYDYPRPALTVDAAVFSQVNAEWRVLLIRRGRPPFQGHWALPGGFIEMDEPLEVAALRELREETGLSGVELEQLRTYGDPKRDPRGRTVSVVFIGITEADHAEGVRGSSDASEAAWFPIHSLPPLAFDHDRILDDAVEWLEHRIRKL